MELEKENTPFYCLITNEHVITEELIEMQKYMHAGIYKITLVLVGLLINL